MRRADAGAPTDDERAEHEVARAPAIPPAPPAASAKPSSSKAAPTAAPAGVVGNLEPATAATGASSRTTTSSPTPSTPTRARAPRRCRSCPASSSGRTLAKQLDVGLGDCVQVTSPHHRHVRSARRSRPPIAKQFRVIAIFEAGFDQYDSKLVYTDLYEAQAFYEHGDSVTGIEMKVDDIDQADAVARDIDHRLNNGIYHTMDWKQLNHGLFTALLIQQIGMSFVLGLIILVAAFTVIATLIMVVLDKKKEIALLKAIGAKNDAILRIFLYQGRIIGLAGHGAGAVGGLPVLQVPARLRLPARPEGLLHLEPAGVDAPDGVHRSGGHRRQHLPGGDHPAGGVRGRDATGRRVEGRVT